MAEITMPRLYIKSQGEDTTKLALKLTTVPHRVIVRFTGGCGLMHPEHVNNLYQMFIAAFHGFKGAIIFGGTRMLLTADPKTVKPGITEIPPLIKKANPQCQILGVIPKTQDLRICDFGMIVSGEPDHDDFFTVNHPDIDELLIVQQSVDIEVHWETEFEECIKLTDALRTFANFDSLLISYNGGGITAKEIEATAELGWPVLLIDNSGRKTEEYCRNAAFLSNHLNVHVCDNTASALRYSLIRLGMIADRHLQVVHATTRHG